MARELLLVTRPPKPVREMSDEERNAWAESIVEEMRRRRRPNSPHERLE